MEIYKLNDGVSERQNSNLKDVVRDSDKLRITELRQGVKNPNRVNVFVDGKYSFSLDVAQVVDFKLKVGSKISEEELAEYKKASEFGKLYQRTLEWTLIRPRSIKETRDYLRRKLTKSPSDPLLRARRYGAQSLPPLPVGRGDSSGDLAELSKKIIERLLARGYLDDRKFAEYYVENRFVKKGISRKRLAMELMKKGVDKGIIDDVLDNRNDEEEILKIIAKKRAKYTDEKLIMYLVRQGFSFELAKKIVSEYED